MIPAQGQLQFGRRVTVSKLRINCARPFHKLEVAGIEDPPTALVALVPEAVHAAPSVVRLHNHDGATGLLAYPIADSDLFPHGCFILVMLGG